MKTILKLAGIALSLVLMLVADISILPFRLPTVQLELVPEAEAQYGHGRRTRRRGVAVGYTMGAAAAGGAGYQQHAAPPPQQMAPPPQQAMPPQQQMAHPPQQAAPPKQSRPLPPGIHCR